MALKWSFDLDKVVTCDFSFRPWPPPEEFEDRGWLGPGVQSWVHRLGDLEHQEAQKEGSRADGSWSFNSFIVCLKATLKIIRMFNGWV